ncbi:MAG TPA: ABC transporter permease subunit [Petrotogaceae bacterium]|nr:ABC transporter permease subunit [Petrotogaceae bacterium]
MKLSTKKIPGSIPGIVYVLAVLTAVFPIFKDFFNLTSFSVLQDSQTMRILFFTFYQALLSSIASLVVSIIPAYYSWRKKNVLSAMIDLSFFIPFFFPVVSMTIAFTALYGRSGLFFALFPGVSLSYSLIGIVVAHVFYDSPIFVKYISEGLRSVPQSLCESAQMDGASKTVVFFSIQLRLILPALVKAFLLVFTYCFMSFGVILSIGGMKFSTVEVAISSTIGSSFDFSKAIVLCAVQFLVIFLLNYTGSKFTSFEGSVQTYPSSRRAAPFTGVFSFIYVLFEYSLIVLSLAGGFFNFQASRFDLSGLINLFSGPVNAKYAISASLINSSLVSLITALICTVLAYIILRVSSRFSEVIILSCLGISPAFISIALLYLNISWLVPYPLLLVFGYVLLNIPIAFSFMYQPVKAFPSVITEAAKMDGATSFKIFSRIHFPLMYRIFVSSFLQIFAIIFGEFTMIYTMQIQKTFPMVSITNYILSSNRMFKESNALSSLSIFIVISVFFFSKILEKKHRSLLE